MTNFRSSICNSQSGQAVIAMVIFVILISLTVLQGFAVPLGRELSIIKDLERSRKSYYTAESAVEDAVYRVRKNLPHDPVYQLILNNAMAEVEISVDGDEKMVNVSGNYSDRFRLIQARLHLSNSQAQFFYGVQSGNDGFRIEGGSTVNGNVYSNGDIIGVSGTITGSATAATPSMPELNQSNGPSFPPSQELHFGGNSTPQDLAQSFQLSGTDPVSAIHLYLKRSTTAWMNNVTLRITSDAGGKPGGTTLASVPISYLDIGTGFSYFAVPFNNLNLNPGVTYWVVLDTGTTWGQYYSIGASSATYANGTAKVGAWSSGGGGTWNETTPSGQDVYFKIYTGGQTSKVAGQSGPWHLSVGDDSWAYEVSNTNTSGNIYCQVASGNAGGQGCDTSRSDPPPANFPIFNDMIQGWKNEADSGSVTIGNFNVGWQGVELGPARITGNLSVGGGGVLTLTGTVWVEGNVTITAGGRVRLDESYGNQSGVLITDGLVNITGNGQFQGSGGAGSYPMLVTTSDCPNGAGCGGSPALYISGGSGAVVLVAQNGLLHLQGGSAARAIVGRKILINGGGIINYDSGLINLNFSSGPGGTFDIIHWREK